MMFTTLLVFHLWIFLSAAFSLPNSPSDGPNGSNQKNEGVPMVSTSTTTTNNNNSKPSILEFHVAPMQGYTNLATRRLFHELAPNAKLWTEMEKVQDLLRANADGLARRFGPPSSLQSPSLYLCLQLGGNDPGLIKDAIYHLARHGYKVSSSFTSPTDNGCSFSEVNLNCGCPSIETGGADTYGASLMRQPALTRSLLQAMVDAVAATHKDEQNDVHDVDDYSGRNKSPTSNVSIKCRVAVYDTADQIAEITTISSTTSCASQKEQSQSQQHYDTAQYDALHAYLTQSVGGSGTTHICLHARAAILAGLSPVQNRKVPPLDYAMVHRLASDFQPPNHDNTIVPRITLNGGISSLSDLQQHFRQAKQTGVSSFMAGRWILRRPLDLAILQQSFLENTQTHNNNINNKNNHDDDFEMIYRNGTALRAVVRYTDYVRECYQGAITRTTTTKTATTTKSKQRKESLQRKTMQQQQQSQINNNLRLPSLQDLCLPLFLIMEQLREDFEQLDHANDDVYQDDSDVIIVSPTIISEAEMEDIYHEIVQTVQWLQETAVSGSKRAAVFDQDAVQFKKLSNALKSLVGTKVANKWKRNRAEL